MKCTTCGAELKGRELLCPVCGFAIPVAPENPETLQKEIRSPSQAEGWYEKALEECRQGQYEEAIVSLQKACQMDDFYASLATTEHDFKPLRTDPRFQELVRGNSETLEETPNPDYYSAAFIDS